jgi:hypothetical protein
MAKKVTDKDLKGLQAVFDKAGLEITPTENYTTYGVGVSIRDPKTVGENRAGILEALLSLLGVVSEK